MTARDWEREIILPRISIGGLILTKEYDSTHALGARTVVFGGCGTRVRVVVWSDGCTLIELRESGAFVYGCTGTDTQEAFERLESYLSARAQVRTAVGE